jgi:hypothetical protein
MEAIEIIEAMKEKARQLDNTTYTVEYIDKLLPPSAVVTIKGATDYFYILGNPPNIKIESVNNELYHSNLQGTGNNAIDRMHIFQGDLTITNLSVAHTPIQLRQQTFAPRQCKPEAKEDKINIEINQKTIIQ